MQENTNLKITGGLVYSNGAFTPKDIFCEKGLFSEQPASDFQNYSVIDAGGSYVIPGLIDLHFHGSNGGDISDGQLDGLHKMGAYEASRGICAMCPATMTLPEENLIRAAKSAAAYEPTECEAELVGINMEGPFISPSKVGAQNPAYVRAASVEEFHRLQEAAQGLFKLVDVAPEEPGALEFIEKTSDEVRISLAHTCADYNCASAAFDAGARQLTHLYNAMNSMHHRKPGPIVAAWEHPKVTCEIIADGIHIHPAMVRLAFTLFGDSRMILISDTLRAAGLGNGTYDLGGQAVNVEGYEARIADGALAGSVSDLMRCFTVAVRDMGIAIESAVKAACENPARVLGIDDRFGFIKAGYPANALIIDTQTIELRQVILRGKAL